jgi:hypothetical protein
LHVTIVADPSDWCISRFSLLAAQIRQAGEAVDPPFILTAQDYLCDEGAPQDLDEQLRRGH